MIGVRVLDIKPHPDQSTNNPDTWAVRFEVTYDGTVRTFWRWHTVRGLEAGRYTSSTKKPTPAKILAQFWGATFSELHGFSFNKDDP